MFWHVVLGEAAIDLHIKSLLFTDAGATWWWWHHMGTFIMVIAFLSVLAAPLLRHFEMRNAEVWVNTVATIMTTMISAMGLSGVNNLKRRKGVKELFSRTNPVEEVEIAP